MVSYTVFRSALFSCSSYDSSRCTLYISLSHNPSYCSNCSNSFYYSYSYPHSPSYSYSYSYSSYSYSYSYSYYYYYYYYYYYCYYYYYYYLRGSLRFGTLKGAMG